ncbi:MAG TPA: hypothetical protein VHW23_27015 [Kofleriaceae bacterium]|nr:hypothetical protein [Kofleriaceae bacterium]
MERLEQRRIQQQAAGAVALQPGAELLAVDQHVAHHRVADLGRDLAVQPAHEAAQPVADRLVVDAAGRARSAWAARRVRNALAYPPAELVQRDFEPVLLSGLAGEPERRRQRPDAAAQDGDPLCRVHHVPPHRGSGVSVARRDERPGL